jgi:hypothetical protein
MATRNIVPRADGEGGIGVALKKWASGYINALTVSTLKITGGSPAASKILVSDAAGNFSPVLVSEQQIVGRQTGGQAGGQTATGARSILGLGTGDSPTFAGATIGSLSGLIKGTAGALSGLTAAQALTEIGIGQAWTTPPFNAGDFTASGAMTWTVAAGNVITYAYNIIGKTMTVAFGIDGAAIGGTPSNILFIAIPGEKTASKITMNPVLLFNGSWSTGYCEVYPGSYNGKILVLLTGAPNFSAGQVKIYGQITFEIN